MFKLLLAITALVLFAGCSQSSGQIDSYGNPGTGGFFGEDKSVNGILYDTDPNSAMYRTALGMVVLNQHRTSYYGPYGLLPYDSTTSVTITNTSPYVTSYNIRITGTGWTWRGSVQLVPGASVSYPNVTNVFYALDDWGYDVGYVQYPGMPAMPTANG